MQSAICDFSLFNDLIPYNSIFLKFNDNTPIIFSISSPENYIQFIPNLYQHRAPKFSISVTLFFQLNDSVNLD